MAKKKNRLPKKIGGFRLPKAVRKSSLLRALLSSPVGRDVLAKAITAGAGAAVAVLVEEREAVADTGAKAVKKSAKKSRRAAAVAGEAVQSAASAVMGVVADAAGNFIRQPQKAKKSGPQATAH